MTQSLSWHAAGAVHDNPCRRQIATPILVCQILVGALLLTGCADAPPAEPVERPVVAMQIPEEDEFEARRLSGQARAAREVNLSFRVAGTLAGLPVSVGDTVVEGQPLAMLDPNDFEVRVRNAEAQLNEGRAGLALAEEEFDRYTRAAEQGAASELEVIQRRTSRDAAIATVAALEATLQTATDQVSYATLSAPFGGRIVATFVDNFEDLQAKQAVLRLLDDSSIEMVVNVPESLIGRASPGGRVFVEFDVLPGTVLDAMIKEIGTEASEVTRTYPVTLSMSQPATGERVLPGMAGVAWGKAPEVREPGVLAPLSAIASDGDNRYVWVIDEGTGLVSKRVVTIGETQSRGVLIEGVEVGEWIATAGVHYLQEGQTVRLQTARAPG